ncbi:MAG: hypothetical protein JWO34_364, partial [Arthrobacter sp.]|nr:hypothetical protein [Arthrobacter sp.]
ATAWFHLLSRLSENLRETEVRIVSAPVS